MISSVEQYLSELRRSLSGSDLATVQDALSDAEEYLWTSLQNTAWEPGLSEADKLGRVIEKYGTPEEIASAYKQVETLAPPAMAEQQVVAQNASASVPLKDNRAFYSRFFGVFTEPRAWGSLLYMLLALATGIFYFTWAVTGLSVSGGLLVLIVGLPIAVLFLLSVRAISLLEGRLVEALLGVRMPRRPRFARKNSGIWQRVKGLLGDKHTWFSLIYMVLQMPLGTAYFTVFVTLIAISISFAVWPIVALALGLPVFTAGAHEYFATGWLVPISVVVGALLLTLTMHLAKTVGRLHGAMAKSLLVRL